MLTARAADGPHEVAHREARVNLPQVPERPPEPDRRGDGTALAHDEDPGLALPVLLPQHGRLGHHGQPLAHHRFSGVQFVVQ